MHPEKVAEEELISTSRDFPLTIKGSKEDVEKPLKAGMAETHLKHPPIHIMKLKAKALRLKLERLKGHNKKEPGRVVPGN